MRFLLRDGSREVIVFARQRFAAFRDLEHAAESLYAYLEDPTNLETFRRLLIEDSDYSHLAHTDPVALATRVADMVMAGRLQVLPHPDALPPWSWPFAITPTHPVAESGAEGEGNPLSDDADEAEEAEDERLDPKPDPIIPPVFPEVAKSEADAIDQENKEYGWKMDMMRFVGEKVAPGAELPKSLVALAVNTGTKMKGAVVAAGGELLPIAMKGMPAINGSSLAGVFNGLAKQQGGALTDGAKKTGEVLATLANGAAKGAGLTKVGPALVDLAKHQGSEIATAAKGVGLDLKKMAAGKPGGIPNPAALPAMFVQAAGKTAGTMASIAQDTGKQLVTLVDAATLQNPTAQAPGQLAKMGQQQAGQLQSAASNTAPALDQFKPSAAELASQPPKAGPNEFAFVLLGAGNAPLGGIQYKITKPDGSVVTGQTDGNGKVKIGGMSVGAKGTLELPSYTEMWQDTSGTMPGAKYHTVKSGDWLSKIAQQYGFKKWRDIYDHPKNADFRSIRPDPDHIQPGDKIFIPENKPRSFTFKVGQAVTFFTLLADAASAPQGQQAPGAASGAPKPAGQQGQQGQQGQPAQQGQQGQPAPQGQQAKQPQAPAPYVQQTPPYQENLQPAAIKPKPAPPKDEVVLIDEGGMLYKVPLKMFEQMQDGHKKLAAVREKIKKAKDLPYDKQANAVEPAMKELEQLCGASPGGAGVQKVSEIAPVDRQIRQFIDPRTMKLVFTPGRLQRELEAMKYPGKWSKERLRDVVDFKKGKAAETAEKLAEAKEDAKKSKSKLGKLNIEAKFKLTDWEESLKGEGSLLDIIDSGDPNTLRTVLHNPAMAPLVLLDAVAEKFPSVMRKNHKTEQYFFDEKSPYWSDSWEASFLRWSYGVEDIAVAWEPGKVKIGGKAAGSLSLISAKGEMALDLPSKEGGVLPIPTKDGSQFKLRVHIVGRISGFVGASAELSCDAVAPTFGLAKNAKAVATGKKSDTPLELGVQGGLKVFAGASVTATGELGLEWFNLKDQKWASFGKVIGEATGIAGAALEIAWALGWNSKTKVFEFEFKCKAALKLGGGAGVKFEIDVNQIIAFIGELLKRTDFTKILDIAKEAFEAYVKFSIAMAINPVGTSIGLLWDLGTAFWGWKGSQDEIRQIADNVNSGKAKQFLEYGAPEAKAGVLAKLCDRSSLLSDEPEELAIMAILESLPTTRAVIKTLERIDPNNKTVEAGIDKIDGCVDWAEQTRFDNFLKKHKLR